MHKLLKSATYDTYDDKEKEVTRHTAVKHVIIFQRSSNITFLGTALSHDVGRKPFHAHTLQYRSTGVQHVSKSKQLLGSTNRLLSFLFNLGIWYDEYVCV
jgi:hypothetical protein